MNSIWYRKHLISYVLWPISLIYQLVILIRRNLYRFGLKKTTHFPVPIIVVGNLTVGGTGKTPLVIAIVHWLKEQGYSNYLGVDISREMIEFCQTHISQKVKQISSINEFLSEQVEVYDVIVMNDVIEHLEKSAIISDLEIIKKALKPGGSLIIKTNNVAAITGARMRFEDFTHETSFTEYSLRQVLRVAGFKKIEMRAFDFPRTSPKRWLRFAMQAVLHALWKFVYFLEYTTVPKIVNEFLFAVAKKEK